MKNVGEIIIKTTNILRIKQKKFIYILKIDLPNEIRIPGKKYIFEELLNKLIKNAEQAYPNSNSENKVILITSNIENSKKLSISITGGGTGLSFLEKALVKQKGFLFREKNSNSDMFQINKILEKEFKAKLEIISKKNKGATFRIIFPLN
ncbi:hypothetical protein KKI22_02370 [Patescibacteria group bacterium]|nr:hypothetical protein [Patescibacteria group bacterium]